MHLREIPMEGQRPIDGYGPGGFRIAGEWSDGSLILTPGGRQPLDAAAGLTPEALAPVIDAAGDVDVVLIGQGDEMRPLGAALRRMFEAAGLGFEHMSTPAACRTYNVMLAEKRRVAAVLIAL